MAVCGAGQPDGSLNYTAVVYLEPQDYFGERHTHTEGRGLVRSRWALRGGGPSRLPGGPPSGRWPRGSSSARSAAPSPHPTAAAGPAAARPSPAGGAGGREAGRRGGAAPRAAGRQQVPPLRSALPPRLASPRPAASPRPPPQPRRRGPCSE